MLLLRPEKSDFFSMGSNWPSVWTKMISSWICIGVYILMLFCPRLLCSAIDNDDENDDFGRKKKWSRKAKTEKLGTLV